MVHNKWNPEWEQAALELAKTYKRYPVIAAKLRERFPYKFFDGDAVRKWFVNNGHAFVKLDTVPQEYAWPGIQKQLDMLWRKYEGSERIFVCSDLHMPHLDYGFAEKAFAYASDCDVAILGGDIFHQDAFGRFCDESSDFNTEYELTRKMLLQLANLVPVILVSGNHDRRLQKYLRKSADTKIDQYKMMLRNQSGDALAILAEDTSCDYAHNWWVQIESVIVSHPDRYSGVPYRNITNSMDYFAPRITKQWDTLCQGHSHQAGEGTYKGRHWFELGVMCNRMDYNAGPSQTNPMWVQGFAVLRLRNGKLDKNKSRLYTGKVFK